MCAKKHQEMNLDIDTQLSADDNEGESKSTGKSSSAVVSPKLHRRQKDAERHRKTYNNETEEQRKKRRERDALRHKLAYQEKLQRKRQEEAEAARKQNPDAYEGNGDSDASDTDVTTSGLYLLKIAADSMESPAARASSGNSRLSPVRRGSRGTPKGTRGRAGTRSSRSSVGSASSPALPDTIVAEAAAAVMALSGPSTSTQASTATPTAAAPAYAAVGAQEEEDPLAEIGALDSFFTFDPSISFDRLEPEEDCTYSADGSAAALMAPVPVPLLRLPSHLPTRVAHVPLMQSSAPPASAAALSCGIAQVPDLSGSEAVPTALSRAPSAHPSPLVHTVSGASQTGGFSSPFHSPVGPYTTAFPFPAAALEPASVAEVPVISDAYLEPDIEITIPNDASLGFDEPFGRDASFELEAEYSVLNDAALQLQQPLQQPPLPMQDPRR